MSDCQNCLRLEEKIKLLQDELKQQQKKFESLQELAMLDQLTQVPNRLFLEEQAPKLIANTQREERNWGLLMVDIDFFKKFNDTYGHPFGDLVLKNVAQMLKSVSRKGDFVVRYGGEEFCVLVFSAGTEDNLSVIAQRYRKAIESLRNCCKVTDKCVSVTVSVGACFVPSDSGASLKEIIGYADKALYKAKSAGRNCVVVSDRRKKSREQE